MAEMEDGLALLRQQLASSQAEIESAQVAINNAQANFAHWNGRKESSEDHVRTLKAVLHAFTGGREGEPRPDAPDIPPEAPGAVPPGGPQQESAASANGEGDAKNILGDIASVEVVSTV